MKVLKIFLLFILLFPLSCVTYANSDINNISYTVGYSIGNNILVQFEDHNITLDSTETISGFIDGIKEKIPKISIEKMDESIAYLQSQ